MCKKINQKKYIQNFISKTVVLATVLLFTLQSCDETVVDSQTETKDSIISTRLFNTKFNIKDSGYDKVIVRSPLVEMYELLDTPFTVFPKGLELNFYKKGADSPGYMRASYASVIEKKKWYEARGNVIVVNEDGDSLKTQKLFWNQKTKRIFTPDTTLIIRKDGTFLTSLNGLDATDDFKEFTFFNNKDGRIFVKDN